MPWGKRTSKQVATLAALANNAPGWNVATVIATKPLGCPHAAVPIGRKFTLSRVAMYSLIQDGYRFTVIEERSA